MLFTQFDEYDLRQEYLYRKVDGLNRCYYGIDYLDDALLGISPKDFVVIGAKTGVGKTELGRLIAFHNAKIGKRVLLYALEAEPFEIHRRIKYQLIADQFFKNRNSFPPDFYFSYAKWSRDEFRDLKQFDMFEEAAIKQLEKLLDSMKVIYTTSADFSKGSLVNTYETLKNEFDLVILDHLHFLAPEESETETAHIRDTVCRLRNLINTHGLPVVAFSHLRKEDRGSKSVVPTIEELHGSSEISKQANHVVTLAPAYTLPSAVSDNETVTPYPGTTLLHVAKSRNGERGCTKYAVAIQFNSETNRYDPGYSPYRINRHHDELVPVKAEEEIEPWMKKNVRFSKV